MARTWAFAQLSGDQFLLLEGPLSFHEHASPSEPMIYAPDFFLRESKPWVKGSRAVSLDARQWRAFFPEGPERDVATPLPVTWTEPDRGFFEDAYGRLVALLDEGVLHKGVPATALEGTFRFDERVARRWLARAGRLRSNLAAYGLFDGESGMIGATPEVLFDFQGDELHTMALAGTRATEEAHGLHESEKDLHEHRLVVDAITHHLEPFGDVNPGRMRVEDFGHLHHLLTPMTVRLRRKPAFEELVEALHPTPALGVFPRNDSGLRWLRAMEDKRSRKRFGAPFGVKLPNGEGKCLVAIRNLQFQEERLAVWAGCGVVPSSRFESEWKEICSKIDAVRSTWA